VSISVKSGDAEPYGILGAPGNDSGATNAGLAYLFSVVGGEPVPQALLQATTPVANEFFGRGVSVYKRPASAVTPVSPARNFALVGAYRATETASTGTFPSKGAIYLFAQEGAIWRQLWRFTPPATGGFAARENALFGYSVAIGRNPREGADQMIIGAPGHSNGVGKVYIMRNYFPFNVVPPAERGGIQSTRQISTGVAGDQYGYAVALEHFLPVLATSRVIAVVGAPGRNNAKGAVFVYDRGPVTSTTGGLGTFPVSGISLAPTGPAALKEGDRFGSAVAINANLVAVGAPGAFEGRGAVYFWERSTSVVNATLSAYVYRGYFTAPDALPGDALGSAISIAPAATGSGFTVVVGAPKADVETPNGVRQNAGKVYVLQKTLGETGAQTTSVRASFNPATGDEFGYSSSSIRGFSVIGAPFSDITGPIRARRGSSPRPDQPRQRPSTRSPDTRPFRAHAVLTPSIHATPEHHHDRLRRPRRRAACHRRPRARAGRVHQRDQQLLHGQPPRAGLQQPRLLRARLHGGTHLLRHRVGRPVRGHRHQVLLQLRRRSRELLHAAPDPFVQQRRRLPGRLQHPGLRVLLQHQLG
jgi:hypothetical protein